MSIYTQHHEFRRCDLAVQSAYSTDRSPQHSITWAANSSTVSMTIQSEEKIAIPIP